MVQSRNKDQEVVARIHIWSGTFTECSKMDWEIVYRIHIWSRTFTEYSKKCLGSCSWGSIYSLWWNMVIIYYGINLNQSISHRDNSMKIPNNSQAESAAETRPVEFLTIECSHDYKICSSCHLRNI